MTFSVFSPVACLNNHKSIFEKLSDSSASNAYNLTAKSFFSLIISYSCSSVSFISLSMYDSITTASIRFRRKKAPKNTSDTQKTAGIWVSEAWFIKL